MGVLGIFFGGLVKRERWYVLWEAKSIVVSWIRYKDTQAASHRSATSNYARLDAKATRGDRAR